MPYASFIFSSVVPNNPDVLSNDSFETLYSPWTLRTVGSPNLNSLIVTSGAVPSTAVSNDTF